MELSIDGISQTSSESSDNEEISPRSQAGISPEEKVWRENIANGIVIRECNGKSEVCATSRACAALYAKGSKSVDPGRFTPKKGVKKFQEKPNTRLNMFAGGTTKQCWLYVLDSVLKIHGTPSTISKKEMDEYVELAKKNKQVLSLDGNPGSRKRKRAAKGDNNTQQSVQKKSATEATKGNVWWSADTRPSWPDMDENEHFVNRGHDTPTLNTNSSAVPTTASIENMAVNCRDGTSIGEAQIIDIGRGNPMNSVPEAPLSQKQEISTKRILEMMQAQKEEWTNSYDTVKVRYKEAKKRRDTAVENLRKLNTARKAMLSYYAT